MLQAKSLTRCSLAFCAISSFCLRPLRLISPLNSGEQILGNENLLRAQWPKYDEALAREEEIEVPVQINGKLRAVILVAMDSTEEALRDAALADEKIQAAIAGKTIVKVIIVPGKLVNIVVSSGWQSAGRNPSSTF